MAAVAGEPNIRSGQARGACKRRRSGEEADEQSDRNAASEIPDREEDGLDPSEVWRAWWIRLMIKPARTSAPANDRSSSRRERGGAMSEPDDDEAAIVARAAAVQTELVRVRQRDPRLVENRMLSVVALIADRDHRPMAV
jgi:hypothetical protein